MLKFVPDHLKTKKICKNAVKDTHSEEAPGNKTPALTKNTNMYEYKRISTLYKRFLN